jgi:hypothetical protein
MRLLPTLLALLPALPACTEALFHGAAPGRGTEPAPPPAALSCQVAPAELAIDAKGVVSVAAADPATLAPEITQTVDGVATTLVYDAASATYVPKAGGANEVSASKAGSYTVELRTADASAPAATCTFEVTEDKPCERTQAIGAQVAFLIDNSNSNAVTDCPSSRRIGNAQGVDLYECQAATSRETALLAAYDLLRSADDGEDPLSRSVLSVASFPTATDYDAGWHKETNGWLEVTAANRDAAQTAMLFARRPVGRTPYGGAFSAATELFQAPLDPEKAKVAVLVTDGEPTDRDPTSVLAMAKALRDGGVDVITIFYTAGDPAERAAQHATMMRSIDRASLQSGQGHWYDESKLGSLDDYIAMLIGGGGQPGLAAAVSDGQVIEVKDAAALKDAFLGVIRSKAIRCEQ